MLEEKKKKGFGYEKKGIKTKYKVVEHPTTGFNENSSYIVLNLDSGKKDKKYSMVSFLCQKKSRRNTGMILKYCVKFCKNRFVLCYWSYK